MKKIIIVVVVLIVLVVAMGYLIMTKKYQTLTSSKLPTATESEIKGWNTYKSTVYGFEIKYPADWKFEEQDTSTVGFFQTGTPKQFESDKYHFPAIRFMYKKDGNVNYELRSQMERKKYKLDNGVEIIKFTPTTKDSALNAIVYVNDKVYVVWVMDTVFGQPNKDISNRAIFDKMFSTIKPIK